MTSTPLEVTPAMATADVSSIEFLASLLAPIFNILHNYTSIFLPPTSLPPHRLIDHKIHLFPQTNPINVRPYRYPHFQKNEMEKLIREMLTQGIIKPITSSFSSPVLLVKKKDGAYRLCKLSCLERCDYQG